MAEEDRGERTEAATPRRLQRAHEQGDLPISREAASLAVLAAATLGLVFSAPTAASRLAATLSVFLAQGYAWDFSDGGAAALKLAALAVLRGAAPMVLIALFAGVAATLLQTRFALSTQALVPNLSRLSPRAGLRRLLGLDGLSEAAKSIAKLGIIGFVVWRAMAADVPELGRAPLWSLGLLLDRLLRQVLHVLLAVVAAQAALTVADFAWVRHRHGQRLRMSREDIREEMKEAEGDPKIKARLKRIRMQRRRKRMLAAVPKATVVVTNPTHYAVALAYDRAKNAAPRVVAKGVDELAARIREVAQDHRVPVVANPPLARALYPVELDTDIPPEHYKAVAELIAYVWRLSRRAAPHPVSAP
jgi:flagellar biosynthetic protein FlhB